MYKRVELKDGVSVQFLGVYVTKWTEDMGSPTVGFTEHSYQLPDAVTELNGIVEIEGPLYGKVLAILKKLDPYTTQP